jgi:hypothetical protein
MNRVYFYFIIVIIFSQCSIDEQSVYIDLSSTIAEMSYAKKVKIGKRVNLFSDEENIVITIKDSQSFTKEDDSTFMLIAANSIIFHAFRYLEEKNILYDNIVLDVSGFGYEGQFIESKKDLEIVEQFYIEGEKFFRSINLTNKTKEDIQYSPRITDEIELCLNRYGEYKSHFNAGWMRLDDNESFACYYETVFANNQSVYQGLLFAKKDTVDYYQVVKYKTIRDN